MTQTGSTKGQTGSTKRDRGRDFGVAALSGRNAQCRGMPAYPRSLVPGRAARSSLHVFWPILGRQRDPRAPFTALSGQIAATAAVVLRQSFVSHWLPRGSAPGPGDSGPAGRCEG